MMKKLIAAFLAGMLIAPVCLAPVRAADDGDITIWTGKGARRNTQEFKITEPTVGAPADFLPGTDNTNSLGTSSLRWDDIQTNDLTVADDLIVTDAVTISGILTALGAIIAVQVSTAPRTSVDVVVTTSGTFVWNTTDIEMCVSSATTQSSLVKISTPSAACTN